MNATPNYVRKYLVKVLAKLAVQSGHAEDCIATLTHAEGVRQFIAHAGFFQCAGGLHEVTHAKNDDAAVQLALLIAQADHHVCTAELWIHHFFEALKQRSVIVQGINPDDQFSLHAVLSKFEGVDFGYAVKYAAKVNNGLLQKGGAA